MNNKFKSGLLIFMLVGPLLFFALFHLFGDNYYSIPKYHPKGIDENNDTIYHRINDFQFVNQFNNTITKEDYADKIFVTHFFYTGCLTTCPVVANNILYLQNSFRNYDDVMFLSLSLDVSDSIEKLQKYANTYKATQNKWNLVKINNIDDVKSQMVNNFKIDLENNSKSVMHSNTLVLVDKNFVVRGYFNGTKEKEVEDLLSKIRILLYEQK